MAFRGVEGVPGDMLGDVRAVAVAAASIRRVLAVAAAVATDSVALLVRRAAAVIAVSVMALPVFPPSAAVIASCPKPPNRIRSYCHIPHTAQRVTGHPCRSPERYGLQRGI